jgi:hemerythrin-like domain-containing protein
MLRDKSLVPLSHQHQRALALCVRIGRAQPIPVEDMEAWQAEIQQLFEQEIKFHFAGEDEVIFSAARQFSKLIPLVEELMVEHASLRELFCEAGARCMSPESLPTFAQQLSTHIRKEERQLFESLQQLMSAAELAHLGLQLRVALTGSAQSCNLPNETTKLKPARR